MDSIYNNTETESQNVANGPDPTLTAQLKRGANWFYWIAGLSLVNSAIYAFGGDISFILGLAVTQLVDGIADAFIAEGFPTLLKGAAVVADLAIAFVFFLFGYFANRGIGLAFIIGSILYVLDGLLYLALGSVFAAAFHAFALFFIIRGYLASRKVAPLNGAIGQ